jgi:hypothetical protein
MQCSESLDEEFGWDCMLGKLCRLAKRCQRASTMSAKTDPAIAIGKQNSTGTTLNYMLIPGGGSCVLQKNNCLLLDDATRQHSLEKL